MDPHRNNITQTLKKKPDVEAPFPHVVLDIMDETKCAENNGLKTEDETGIHPNVRHASHYYNNKKKINEINHVVGYLSPKQENLVQIQQSLSDIISQLIKVKESVSDYARF